MATRKQQSDPPKLLDTQERDELREWCESRYPQFLHRLGPMWQSCRDWHLGRGIQRFDWTAVFRQWIRKEQEWQASRRQTQTAPRRDGNGQGPQSLAEILGLKGESEPTPTTDQSDDTPKDE